MRKSERAGGTDDNGNQRFVFSFSRLKLIGRGYRSGCAETYFFANAPNFLADASPLIIYFVNHTRRGRLFKAQRPPVDTIDAGSYD